MAAPWLLALSIMLLPACNFTICPGLLQLPGAGRTDISLYPEQSQEDVCRAGMGKRVAVGRQLSHSPAKAALLHCGCLALTWLTWPPCLQFPPNLVMISGHKPASEHTFHNCASLLLHCPTGCLAWLQH